MTDPLNRTNNNEAAKFFRRKLEEHGLEGVGTVVIVP